MRGYKICSKCDEKNWVRSSICKRCSAPLEKKEKVVIPSGKRGSKVCSECAEPNGPRAFKCKRCGHEFEFAVKKTEIDWTSLEVGDTIKIMSSGGPYYTTEHETLVPRKTEEGNTVYVVTAAGTRIPMNHHGIYVVHAVKDDGIVVFGRQRKNRGFSFIYMGEPRKLSTGTIVEPHRIEKVKKIRKHKYVSV
jgi:ribosomal protein L40E